MKKKAGDVMIADIIGAGSMGMLLAGKLGAAGIEARLVTRTRAQAEQLGAEGLQVSRVDGASGSSYKPLVVCISDYPASVWDKADWILLTVKQKDLSPELLETVSLVAGKDAGIVSFQNGIGHMSKLAEVFGEQRVYAAVSTEGARRLSAVEVLHTGEGVTHVGAFRRGERGITRLVTLIAHMNHSGMQTVLSERIENKLWDKLIINAVINPLTAVLRVSNGDLLRGGEWRELMRQIYEEGISVADRLKIGLSDGLWEHICEVCEATAANHSSMLQDIEAGRTTEVEWINGSLLREAERLGLRLPVTQTVYRLVKGLEGSGISDR